MFNRIIPPDSFYPFEVAKGARFPGTEDYLTRTFATSSRREFVFSTWIKKCVNRYPSGTAQFVFSGFTDNSNRCGIILDAVDRIGLYQLGPGGVECNCLSVDSVKLMDPAGWYHILMSVDTTQALQADRVRAWINSVEIGFQHLVTFAQNEDLFIGHSNAHYLGDSHPTSHVRPFMGYLAETVFLQGVSIQRGDVAVIDFGQAVANTWTPKKISFNAWSGYGAESFYFEYKDGAEVNSRSGGSNWTIGAVSTSVKPINDSPTNNFPTWNVLETHGFTFSMANLTAEGNAAGWRSCPATHQIPETGKYYFAVHGGNSGIGRAAVGVSEYTDCGDAFWVQSDQKCVAYINNGTIAQQGNSGVATGKTEYGNNTGVYITVAIDMDGETVEFFADGVSQYVYSISAWSKRQVYPYIALNKDAGNAQTYAAFGQLTLSFNPTGYKLLCTKNFPDPQVINPTKGLFSATWTGDDTTSRNITGANFDLTSGSIIFEKGRTIDSAGNITDTIHGDNKMVRTSADNVQDGWSIIDQFLSNGFSVTGSSWVNDSPYTYVGHAWKLSRRYGVEVVTYTGNGVARNISHSLGLNPQVILIKRLDVAHNWRVYMPNSGKSYYLELNTTAASTLDTTVWDATAPSAGHFRIGTHVGVNANNGNYVAFLFTSIEGFSQCRTQYFGNGSTDGAFVPLNFRPAFVLIKNRWGTNNWLLFDKARNPNNPVDKSINPNAASFESSTISIDFLSNGFKVRSTDAAANTDGYPYSYMAFADQPFKYSNAR